MGTDPRTGADIKSRESYVRDWSRVDPAAAPFLGKWRGPENEMSIFPSTVRGRVCVIDVPGDEPDVVYFGLGKVSNGQIRVNLDGSSPSVIIKEQDLLGVIEVENNNQAQILEHVYPRRLQALTDSFLDGHRASKVSQQFNRAGCTASLPSDSQLTKGRSPNPGQLTAKARLTPAQLNQLMSLGLKIVVPAYVPAGFRIANVLTIKNSEGTSSAIIYKDKKNRCFALETTSGGVGDLGGNRSYRFNNLVFGSSTLEEGKFGISSRSTLLGQWLGSGPFYRFAGGGYISSVQPKYDLSGCNNISLQDAIRVSESLRYLR